MTYFRLIAATLTASVLAAPPAFAAKALDGSMSLTASSVIGFPVLARVDSPLTQDSWSNVPAKLLVSAKATAQFEGNSVVTHATESATWSKPELGTIEVTDFGHEFNVSDASVGSIETLVGDGGVHPDWTYGFQATADGAFNIDFVIHGRGDELVGLGRFQLQIVGDGLEFFDLSDGFLSAGHPEDNLRQGSFSHALRKGEKYRVSLVSLDSIGSFTPNHQKGAMDALFSWSISENAAGVPEPSTWALSILGFGLAGAALRRRRTLARA